MEKLPYRNIFKALYKDFPSDEEIESLANKNVENFEELEDYNESEAIFYKFKSQLEGGYRCDEDGYCDFYEIFRNPNKFKDNDESTFNKIDFIIGNNINIDIDILDKIYIEIFSIVISINLVFPLESFRIILNKYPTNFILVNTYNCILSNHSITTIVDKFMNENEYGSKDASFYSEHIKENMMSFRGIKPIIKYLNTHQVICTPPITIEQLKALKFDYTKSFRDILAHDLGAVVIYKTEGYDDPLDYWEEPSRKDLWDDAFGDGYDSAIGWW